MNNINIIISELPSNIIKCIHCNQNTPYKHNFPIDKRLFYINDIGQLCALCYVKTYRHIDNSNSNTCIII